MNSVISVLPEVMTTAPNPIHLDLSVRLLFPNLFLESGKSKKRVDWTKSVCFGCERPSFQPSNETGEFGRGFGLINYSSRVSDVEGGDDRREETSEASEASEALDSSMTFYQQQPCT